MDRVSEQGLASARLAEKHDRYLGFCCQRGQLQTARHSVVARGQVLDSQSGEGLLHCDSQDLLLHAFAQLPNWLERIFDQRASSDNNVRIPPHADA